MGEHKVIKPHCTSISSIEYLFNTENILICKDGTRCSVFFNRPVFTTIRQNVPDNIVYGFDTSFHNK